MMSRWCLGGKRGTGSVARVGLALGETSLPRCLPPFFGLALPQSRERGQAPSPQVVSAVMADRGDGASPLSHDRRGTVTVWTLLFVVVLLTILYAVIQVAQLWLAREKLENAIEAATLAAAKQWGDTGGGSANVAAAQSRGEAYATANTVNGIPLDLTNSAVAPSVNWQFGSATCSGTGYNFTANPNAASNLAVVLQTTFTVTGLFQQLFGEAISSSTVQARVAAFCDTSVPSTDPRRIRLIRLND